MDWGRKKLAVFNARKPQLVLFDQSKNTGAIDVKIFLGGPFLRKNNLFRCWG